MADLTKLADAPGANFGPLGEKEHLIFLYDFGVGDEVFYVPTVSVQAQTNAELDVVATGHARVTSR